MLSIDEMYFIIHYQYNFSTLSADPPSVKAILPQEEASIATSLWPIRQRTDRSGRVKLNKFQRKAVDLACSNEFVMIQGPPGIQVLFHTVAVSH